MSSHLNATHLLEAESFSQGFTALLERLLPETTTGVVWLAMENIEMSPDGETCRRTWDTVREHFTRRPSEDDGDQIAWSCSTTTDVGQQALFALVDLITGIAGRHFLFRVELRRETTPLLSAIPHTPSAGIDATQLSDEFPLSHPISLRNKPACLSPDEQFDEWVAHDLRWSIRGGNICIEALDRQRTVCYGIIALRRLVTVADEAFLSLSWGGNDPPADPVDKLDA